MAGPVGPSLEVSWDAPASCPDAATARAVILARVADRPAAHELEATARVHALDDGTWEVEVVLRRDDGTATRTLRAASCDEALTATAVVVAIAVDPSLEAESTEAESTEVVPSPDLVPPPPTRPRPSAEPTLAPAPAVEPAASEASPSASTTPRTSDPTAKRRPLDLAIVARGGLDVGALPSPAGHVAAALGLRGRRFEIQAGALHRFRTETSVAGLSPPAGGRFRLTAAQLRAGPRLSWGAFELPLAAGLELGAIGARGTGAVDPIPVRRSWIAAVASAGVGWAPRATFAVQLGIDGVVPLLRPTFMLDDDVEVLTVGPIAARAWVGVSGRFTL